MSDSDKNALAYWSKTSMTALESFIAQANYLILLICQPFSLNLSLRNSLGRNSLGSYGLGGQLQQNLP